MKYEKTQKGNPHQLTIHQHCFPKKSIERFCDENGVVRVHLIREHKSVLLKPEHPIFCARRVWDQRAESVFMQSIENRYQDLASKLATGGAAHWFSTAENQVVTDMYSLWHVRCCWKHRYIENQELIGILAPSGNGGAKLVHGSGEMISLRAEQDSATQGLSGDGRAGGCIPWIFIGRFVSRVGTG